MHVLQQAKIIMTCFTIILNNTWKLTMLMHMLRKTTSPRGANCNTDHWLAEGGTKTPLKNSRQCLTLSTRAPRQRFTVLLAPYLKI